MEKIPKSKVMEYILAGNGIITVRSKRTGEHLSFSFKQSSDGLAIWVRGKIGQKYEFIGTIQRIYNPPRFTLLRKEVTAERFALGRAFEWVFKAYLTDFNKAAERSAVWHEGVCGCCGRRLTTPESIAAGFGPVCAARG